MTYFYTNSDVAWVKVAKNACTSWGTLFERMGWQKHDIHRPGIDMDNLKFFGLLQDPEQRHSTGIAQYLRIEGLSHLVDHPLYQRLLVSACFDEHSYNLFLQIPESIIKRTTWFCLEAQDYEQLVRNFLKKHNVDLPPVPRLNQSPLEHKILKEKIQALKQKYPESHSKLAKNFLGADLALYRDAVEKQHLWVN